MNHNDIWREKAKLDKARRQHREALMKDYKEWIMGHRNCQKIKVVECVEA